ncbi:MAG: hypothetical protein LAQ30_15310 [Acidobacteriia bacterium]|nr:hypothetical protein [Terriglobia bacterium]
MKVLIPVLITLPLALAAQPRLGAGLKFGIPFQGWFEDVQGREFSFDASRGWAVGPALELRLIGGVSVEASGLYRQVGRDAGGGYSIASFSDRERGYSWEFPLVARVRLPLRFAGFRPLLEGGPAVNWLRTHTGGIHTAIIASQSSFITVPVAVHSSANDLTPGVTAGGGLERPLGPLRVSLDVRYTRWKTGYCSAEDLRCIALNQGALQLGIGF